MHHAIRFFRRKAAKVRKEKKTQGNMVCESERYFGEILEQARSACRVSPFTSKKQGSCWQQWPESSCFLAFVVRFLSLLLLLRCFASWRLCVKKRRLQSAACVHWPRHLQFRLVTRPSQMVELTHAISQMRVKTPGFVYSVPTTSGFSA